MRGNHLRRSRAVGSPPSARVRAKSALPVDHPSSKSCAASLICKAGLVLQACAAQHCNLQPGGRRPDLRRRELLVCILDQGCPLGKKAVLQRIYFCLTG